MNYISATLQMRFPGMGKFFRRTHFVHVFKLQCVHLATLRQTLITIHSISLLSALISNPCYLHVKSQG